ncbi:MAG TPA: undecaprenyldiphospho-muramoylpentapeptide beta-N-acetylglucosaminyltransferase [Bdellovibrionales bacterium]|nr:undecaprenyldiphospho-muramoylpentapeptide beta-N-acetylglucosaminyltransferase [Bdellovibrionales bacterium]
MSQPNQDKVIVIAGGGTGGHVYPALAIASAIKAQNKNARIHFVGTEKGIESRLVPQSGYELHCLPVAGLKNTSVVSRVKALLLIPVAVFKSVTLLLKLRPAAVLGVGGYASGPFVMAASLTGFKTAVWEPNAAPGLTNRILGRFVRRAYVVFEHAAKAFGGKNVTLVGMPVRKGIVPHSRPGHQTLRVLVFGGSQGARGINTVVSDAVVRGGAWLNGVEVVHQTGRHDFEAIKEKYKNAPPNVSVHAYLDDMDKRYQWADVVICRAGASTVAELAAAQKCAVLIPFPFAADQHQQKNAESLVAKNAAQMVLQQDFTVERFIAILEAFKAEPSKIAVYERNIAQFHKPEAAEFIAQQLLD